MWRSAPLRLLDNCERTKRMKPHTAATFAPVTLLALLFMSFDLYLRNHDAHDSANLGVALVVCIEDYFSLSLTATRPRNLKPSTLKRCAPNPKMPTHF